MARVVVGKADEVLDNEFPVLDKGFVRLVDYLGGDERIVAAARVSYGSGTMARRRDQDLIRYLIRHGHTSPFEQVVLTFHVKLPVFVARQWVRHRTARLNEISGRYSVIRDEFYVPSADRMRKQGRHNKQASAQDALTDSVASKMVDEIEVEQRKLYDSYQSRLADGLAREVARVNLPLSVYTEWYWQSDLHNLFNFVALRNSDDAQHEIREYALVIGRLAQHVAPIAWGAFEEYILGSRRVPFSTRERARALSERVQHDPDLVEILKEIVGDDR